MIESELLQEQLDYDHFKDHERILQFRAKLRKFVREYISEHSYVNSRKLAKLYLEYRNYEKKDGFDKNKIINRLSFRFSNLLIDFKKAGLIAKYNAKQYKKVKTAHKPNYNSTFRKISKNLRS